MMLNSVDLPQPDGPMIDTNSPLSTAKETSSTAVSGPSSVANRLVMPRTSSSAIRPAAAREKACSEGSSARRNLDQLGELLLRQRRRGELERDGVLHDRVESDDAIGIDRRL